MSEKRRLALVVDMYGCPNRCRHCWLGHMPNRVMEEESDEWLVELFKPYFEEIEFYSWLREPDFAPDYRTRWQRDQELSVNARPERFELASFWRLVRDADYARFLKESGVKCVQLTFFGLEATTDRYVGRPGAFRELLKATDILLANGIAPRWQVFINEENREEIIQLLKLTEELKLKERTEAIGSAFRFFVHAGSCDGENAKLYPIRIRKQDIPEELIPYYLNYQENYPESELCQRWQDDDSCFVPHNEGDIVLNVANNYDLFFNFTNMHPVWKIGNLKSDPIEDVVRRVVEEDIWALREARRITLGQLVRLYGDFQSKRAFEEEDYKMYLLNRHLEANQFRFVTLREAPELLEKAAAWFHEKWGVPEEAYRECMEPYLQGESEYGWYLCLQNERIVSGLGVIANDFHDRPDLTPNICAVYTEEDCRGQGLAGRLLNMAVEDLRARGITPVYLLTDHIGFYERYGWQFLDFVQGEGEETPSRMYIHH
ncbi:MAG: GNAT family N-acetyltransferase [Erysipelotrichaceae bacterium]|nr:GNAT family N-acetyltransferase [Erysipelotrichaceae bacterium]